MFTIPVPLTWSNFRGHPQKLKTEQVARQVSYWLDIADYDMAVARTMLSGGHFLYVGFMCHQVAEKGLKALYAGTVQVTPPFTHALVKLAKLSNSYDELHPEDQALLDLLEPLNIEARYPTQKAVVMQSLTAERCRMLIQGTERLLQWIHEKCDVALKNMPA